LELVLNAPHIVQRIDELKTGISDSGLNLTQDRFFTLEIPIPSLEAQLLIIEKVQIQVESIRNQEKSIDLSLKQSTAQRQNILRAAFAGQLVPQDPNDEPASVLLERIRAERALQAASKKTRGRKAKEGV
jgi:type I restriction enzyme S subunit